MQRYKVNTEKRVAYVTITFQFVSLQHFYLYNFVYKQTLSNFARQKNIYRLSMKYIKTTILLLFAAMFAHADEGTLYTSNMLSSALIECVSQDKYGYIWVGTEFGLNKFDGYRFTTYYYNREDTTTVNDNEIVRVFCDREGRLWIGCRSGLCRYDYERDLFVRYHFPDSRSPRVNSLCQCGNGDILIGTAGYGLYSIRNGEDTITEEKNIYQGKNDVYYSRLFVDDHDMLWRSDHLNVFSRITIRDHKLANIKNFVSPVGPPISFLPTGDGNLLIVCMYGILRYDYGMERVTDAGYNLSDIVQRHSIRKAIIDNKRNIYLGTSGQGLMKISHDSNELSMVDNNNGTFNMASSDIEDMLEDKDGNLWLACYQKGLFLLKSGNDAFNSWSFSKQNYSIGTSVSSIALDENGDVLCTVQNTGVYRFDKHGRIMGRLIAPIGSKVIHRDVNGQFWICSNNTLFRYYPSTGNSQSILNSEGKGWGLNCMTSDKLGNLFISNYGKGLIIYNTSTREQTTYSMYNQDEKNGRLCNDWIKCMFADRYGIIWIGTANGICCFNPQTRSFKQFKWEVQLENQQCMAIGENREGEIVICTNAGLYLFDRISNKISPFPNSDSLKDMLIYGVVTDREGDLWLSTSMGIWHYQDKNRQWLAHINGNGLTTKEYVLGATMQTSDGMIGFGTNDGITTFYPNNVRTSKIEMGDVYLTHFLVGGRSENCMKNDFSVAYNENSFTMEFSLLTYNNSENISFEYRINDSKEWLSTAEGSNAITFNKMQPGKYKIEVRATCNGIASKGTKVIYVTVMNPWYASPLAYLLYMLLFGTIVFFGLSYYVRQRKAEMEESKMRFLINATHDIRSPLTLIMGPLNKLKQRMNDEESLHDIDTIDRNAQRLLLLVNQILDERKIDKHQMHLHCQKTDMVPFINGIFMLYQYNAQQRNIQYTFEHSNEKITAWIDRINFDKVISNLLSNAFKYTFDGGEVVVKMEVNKTDKDKDEIEIQVIDNGIGLSESNTDRLFERFYQGSNSRDVHLDGTGIGLNLSKAIVEMHGGTISATNRTDGMRGTILTVKLPTGNEHLKPEEIMSEEDQFKPQGNARRQASKNFRILIADDDAEIASYIRNELGNWYRFDAAPNGKEALKALLTGKYDLLISDIMMPEMDGITLLKNIKSNTNISDIPVILLTSKSEVSDRLEGFKKGADAFLAKPFNMEELHILIDNLVDNVRRLRGKYTGAQQQEEKMEKVEVKGNNDALMERIMKCINENLQDPDFNVEKLTEKVGISRAQLHRKMKEITGISAGDFIRNLRLEQAARLIKERKINVTQVAYAVGFNNQAHFSTVFKKHFGLTPTDYSEQERKKAGIEDES